MNKEGRFKKHREEAAARRKETLVDIAVAVEARINLDATLTESEKEHRVEGAIIALAEVLKAYEKETGNE